MPYQTQLTLHRHAYHFLRGEPGADAWRHAGDALTASTAKLYAEFGLTPVVLARIVIAWRPNDNGRGATGVRIVQADDGPANLVELYRDQRTGANPRVSWHDITAEVNALIAARTSKQFLLQTLGNGAYGPLVYAAWVDLVHG